MTIFGVDFHPVFQSGLDMASLKQAGMTFALCKVTEGSGWYRDGYHRFSAAAKSQGLLFCAYHFLRSESSGQAQADWCRAKMGADWGRVPVMLDWETSVSNTNASPADAVAFITRATTTGGRVTLNYCPRWFWDRIGRPALTQPWIGRLGLIQSSYVSGTGRAEDLYPGDQSQRWTGFGGRQVDILQFSSKCQVPGYAGPLDINAYRGTRAQLAATGWFHDPNPALNEEDDMDLGDESTIPSDLVPFFNAAGSKVQAGAKDTVNRLLWLASLRGLEAKKTAGEAKTAALAAGKVEIDYDLLAAKVAALIPPGTGGPVDLAAVATAVADEQARRQAE